MKRKPKQVIKDAAKLMMTDIKNNKIAIMVVGIYFIALRFFAFSSCPSVMLTGYPCPACGLSRAGIALLKGQFQEAFYMNACIYMVALLVVLFVVIRYLLQQSVRCLKYYIVVLLICMVGYYVYRMLTQFPGTPPMSYYQDNFFHVLWNL